MWVELCELSDELFDLCSGAFFLVGAELRHLFVLPELCELLQLLFADEAEWSYELHLKLLHLKCGRYGRERALVDDVHEHGLYDIIFVVSEGYLVAS